MMELEPQQQAPRRVTRELQLRDLPARKEPHALWRAARAGDVDAVREAVSAGLSLDARDGLGRTPLVVAVVHGRKRCVDVLLDGGADPETPSGHRSRPLAYAAFRGDAALCARLLGAGADPNKKAADGWTALHVAARAFINPSAPSTRRLLDGVRPHRSPRARAPPTSSDCSWRGARRATRARARAARP